MTDASRRFERELQRAEKNDRAMRQMLAELGEETAELNALLESAGMEPIASFEAAAPTRFPTRAANPRTPMIRA